MAEEVLKAPRVTFKFYKLKAESLNLDISVNTKRIFTEGITVDDVYQENSIDYVKIGLASFTVYKDDEGYYFYRIANGEVRYIPKEVSEVASNLPTVFEFHVNPTHIAPQYSKLKTEIRTRAGWEVQHWGDNLTAITVNGKSGSLHTDSISQTDQGFDRSDPLYLQKSAAWKKLAALRKYYSADHVNADTLQNYRIGFSYYDKFYIGYFESFSGPEADAESPYMLTYSFTFKVEREVDTLSEGLYV